MRLRSRTSAGTAGIALAVALTVPAQAAEDGPGAAIRPGVPTLTGDVACIAGFVFTDKAGELYISTPASCGALGDSNSTDGCNTRVRPLETAVRVGPVTGTIAYSSWVTMQEIQEKDANACASNDLALIQLPRSVRNSVSPTVPEFGGPTGLRTTPGAPGEALRAYSENILTDGVDAAATKQGVLVLPDSGGWGYSAYFATPAVFGDAGAGVLDAEGRALGVITSLSVAPVPGSNGVADLAKMLAYAREHSGIKGLRLLPGK